MVTKDYNYSRPLDVHRWSCYTESNTFINFIYDTHFKTDKANKKLYVRALFHKFDKLEFFVNTKGGTSL